MLQTTACGESVGIKNAINGHMTCGADICLWSSASIILNTFNGHMTCGANICL